MKKRFDFFDLNKTVICPICKNKVQLGDTIRGTKSTCKSCYEKTHKKGE